MRAGCNDFFDAIIIQYLDILIGHHLEHEFIASATSRISGTHFFFAENSKGSSGFCQNTCKSKRNPLRALIKTTGAAYPE